MKYTLIKGNNSNYQIALEVTAEEMAANKNKVLKQFQKDMDLKGFRKGEVPLDMVEKNVQPTYVQLALFEEAVHQGTMQVVKENEEVKFIGNIYDLQQEEKDGTITFSYKLDIYPEVEIKNADWEKKSLAKVDSAPSDQDLEETLANLQKQYADYQAYDTIEADTVAKIKFQIIDAAGEELDTGSLFLGNEEYDEFALVKTTFFGKKNAESFQFDYVLEDLPPMLHMRKPVEGKTPTHIKATIEDVKKVTLPEWNEENIKKFFGNEELSTLDELKAKVSDAIGKQKKEALLMGEVEKYLEDIKGSFGILIPKTLVEEEMKSRMKSLEERFGGEEGLKAYYEKIGEEEQKKMNEEIKGAASSSLEKFFLLRQVIEKLDLKIEDKDRQTPMAIEEKLYGHFNK